MAWRYRHNDQIVAEGERAVLLGAGKFYIRTGVLGTALTDPALLTVTYRLREIYDDAAPVNHPPVGAPGSTTFIVDPKP